MPSRAACSGFRSSASPPDYARRDICPFLLPHPCRHWARSVASCSGSSSCGGLSWPLDSLRHHPAGQWAYYVTPFGVSYFLYVINFLWLPDHTLKTSLRAWGSTVAAVVGLCLAWFGGREIAARARAGPMPFSALLVQPNRVVPPRSQDDDRGLPIAGCLDRLTRDALDEAAPVDLIIWPEAVLRRLQPPSTGQDDRSGAIPRDRGLPSIPVSDLSDELPRRGDHRNGSRPIQQRMPAHPRWKDSQYDKRMLVVVAEQDFTPGGDYRCLSFVTQGRPDRADGSFHLLRNAFPMVAPI